MAEFSTTYRGFEVWYDEGSETWRTEGDENSGWSSKSVKLGEIKKRIDKRLEEQPRDFEPFGVIWLEYGSEIREGSVHIATLKKSSYGQPKVYVRNNNGTSQLEVGKLYLDTPENRDALAVLAGMKEVEENRRQAGVKEIERFRESIPTIEKADILKTLTEK